MIMTKFQYYQHTFKNTFKIFSRASFEEFISFFYITVLFGLFWAFVYIFTQILENPSLILAYHYTSNFLLVVYLLVITSLFIRRLHDIGKSSIYVFVPLYNVVLMMQEGEKQPNKYGEKPV